MKRQIDAGIIGKVCDTLIASDCYSAVKYLDEKTVVRATWRNKPRGRNTREEMCVTFGAPNYREAEFVRQCKKAGEPFPVKKIQLRAWPKPRVKK